MTSSNPHLVAARHCIAKLTAHIVSPPRVAVLGKKERAAIHDALSQWRSRTASARSWLAAQYPDLDSIPQSLILGMSELEEDIDTLAFAAAHKALGIFLDVAQVVACSKAKIAARTNAGQPQLLLSSWDHTEAELLQELEKQRDLDRLGKGAELFRRLVTGDYGTTITKIRARVDALQLGAGQLSPHPVAECPRLKLLGRLEQQLLGDIADAASYLWTEFPDPAQLMARYQTETTMYLLLIKDRRSEIVGLLDGMVAEALDCACDVKLSGASKIRPVTTQRPTARVQGWRFRLAVLVQLARKSWPLLPFMLREAPSRSKLGQKDTLEAAKNMRIWHRVRAVTVGRGYRHAAFLFAVAVLLNASFNITVGGFLGNDPVADIRVALARPDLLWSETLETPLSSYVSFHLQFASLVLTAKMAISGIPTINYPGSRWRGMAVMSAPFSDLLKVVLMVTTLAIVQRVFCLAMQLGSLGIIFTALHGSNLRDWKLLMAKDLTSFNPDPSSYFTAMHILFCIINVAALFVILVMLISKGRFVLPTMVFAAARCIWYAVGHRSVVYLPLETANFFVAVGFAILGALMLLEEFFHDPMRLEASRCLGVMSRDAAVLAYKESEQRALHHRREDTQLRDPMQQVLPSFALITPPSLESGNGTRDGGNSTGNKGSSITINISSNSTKNGTQNSTDNGTSMSMSISVSTSGPSTATIDSLSTSTSDPSTATIDSPKSGPSNLFRPPNPELFAPAGPDETCRTPTGGALGPGVFCYCHGHLAFNSMIDAAIDEACDSWHNLTLYRSEQVAYVKRVTTVKPVYLWMINNCVRERREAVVDRERCKAAMQVIRRRCQWPYWQQRGGHVTMNLDYEIGQEPDKCLMARLDVEDQ
ncbi:hypothetical protein MCOR15_001386 [Pyricularia oryzae]|nr:hypothetical protein MCOR15_001386 [Pyricularia oryzae]